MVDALPYIPSKAFSKYSGVALPKTLFSHANFQPAFYLPYFFTSVAKRVKHFDGVVPTGTMRRQ